MTNDIIIYRVVWIHFSVYPVFVSSICCITTLFYIKCMFKKRNLLIKNQFLNFKVNISPFQVTNLETWGVINKVFITIDLYMKKCYTINSLHSKAIHFLKWVSLIQVWLVIIFLTQLLFLNQNLGFYYVWILSKYQSEIQYYKHTFSFAICHNFPYYFLYIWIGQSFSFLYNFYIFIILYFHYQSYQW